jgi:nitrate/nitrite transporter NarK
MFVTTFPLAIAYFHDASDLLKSRGSRSAGPTAAIPFRGQDGSTFHQALQTPAFWLMAISFAFGGGGLVGLIVHFIPMLMDNGLTPLTAASAASALSIAAIVGRLAGGVAMDRVFAPRIAAVAFVCPIIACAALTLAPGDVGWAFASGALIGLALGAEYNLMSYLSARYFGFRQYGVIYGAIFGAFTLGQAVSPPVVGYLYAETGNYRIALMALSVCFLLSALFLQLCGRYPDLERREPEGAMSAALEAGAGGL